jgi:cytochrome c oxidase assembly protein subunit 15
MSKNHKPVIIWLFIGAVLVFIMTAIGGVTRLTESGLSMVDWNLIMGSIPPLTEEAWQIAFDQYKQFPEYKITHSHFSLNDFKSIFFWEFSHRLLGRVIGLVFIIPFVIFIIKGMVKGKLLNQLFILLAVGAFQGFLGWYMVSSGLVNEPRVSHFRLAAHLSTAFFTISYSVWLAVGLMQENTWEATFNAVLPKMTWLGLIFLSIQIIFGAFVAGKDAGMIHNYWPNMNPGEFISSNIFDTKSIWLNLINNPSGIQFTHRYIAYLVVLIIGYLWYLSRETNTDKETKKRFNIILGIVIFQFVIGVFTLIMHVPISLGMIHQLGALLLLLSFIYALRWITPIAK